MQDEGMNLKGRQVWSWRGVGSRMVRCVCSLDSIVTNTKCNKA